MARVLAPLACAFLFTFWYVVKRLCAMPPNGLLGSLSTCGSQLHSSFVNKMWLICFRFVNFRLPQISRVGVLRARSGNGMLIFWLFEENMDFLFEIISFINISLKFLFKGCFNVFCWNFSDTIKYNGGSRAYAPSLSAFSDKFELDLKGNRDKN